MPKQRTEHEQQSRRRLRQGILWSLAAHVLVLGLGFNLLRWPDGAGTALTDSRLSARLLGPVTTMPVPLPDEEAGKPRVVPARPLGSTSARAVSAVPPVPTFSAEAAVERRRSAVTTLSSTSAGLDTTKLDTTGLDMAGLDANALRGYRLALAIEARRFKRVPDQAQAEGWAGTADVRLAIAAGGQAISVELAKSSGYAALDTAALSMIDAAAQRALLPPQLQQRAFVLTLPVVFKAAE
jgi:protein TonB